MLTRSIVVLAAAIAAPFAAASYSNATTTITTVVESFTTYCPYPTTFTINAVEYCVSEATTLTITNCPCTLTKAVPVEDCTTTPVPPPQGTGSHGKPAAPTQNYVISGAAGQQQNVFGLVVALGAAALGLQAL